MTIPTITPVPLNGDDLTISPQAQKVKVRAYTGDEPLDYDDVDNNFELLRTTVNQLITAVNDLETRVKALEG
tara:strand:+ start:769 stop:984 length:216 start_codon:yes stop_codon:yes gene_type:complete